VAPLYITNRYTKQKEVGLTWRYFLSSIEVLSFFRTVEDVFGCRASEAAWLVLGEVERYL
jgi:hypothetical protein